MSKYIDADLYVEMQIYDDEHEEWTWWKGTIEDLLDQWTEEGCPPTIEVSEDCISRKGLIDSFLAANKCKREEAKACLCFVDLMLELIEDAPSVTTEQSSMVGKWQITGAYPHNVYCSECHKKFAQTHWTVWEDGSLPRSYCPNCGAKMKG